LAGKDGANGVDGKDGAPGLAGKDGANGVDGKDGAPGLAGKDGANGVDGKDCDMESVKSMNKKMIDEMIEARINEISVKASALIPRPADGRDGRDGVQGNSGKDGTPGLDGKDGMSIEDIDVTLTDSKTLIVTLDNGVKKVKKEIKLPYVKHVGTYKYGQSYLEGDCVTYGGSMFIAKKDTSSKPGEGGDFQLSVKGAR
jgi:integrin beta 3